MSLWFLGYPDQALQLTHQAVELALQLGHPFSLVLARWYRAQILHHRRDAEQILGEAASTFALASEHGFAYHAAAVRIVQGWARAALDKADAALQDVEPPLTMIEGSATRLRLPDYLAMGSEVLHFSSSGRRGARRPGTRLVDQ